MASAESSAIGLLPYAGLLRLGGRLTSDIPQIPRGHDMVTVQHGPWATSPRQGRQVSLARMRDATVQAPITPIPSMTISRTVPSRPGTNV
jgi:hypothetical protein